MQAEGLIEKFFKTFEKRRFAEQGCMLAQSCFIKSRLGGFKPADSLA
jgi:hypothetical protein